MPKTLVKQPSASSAQAMFRALSDRTRLRILRLLWDRELCVCDLVAVLGFSQPKVSRHLAYLRRVGLVTARKEGLWMHYRLAPARGGVHRAILECLEACAREMPDLAADAAKLSRIGCSQDCC